MWTREYRERRIEHTHTKKKSCKVWSSRGQNKVHFFVEYFTPKKKLKQQCFRVKNDF